MRPTWTLCSMRSGLTLSVRPKLKADGAPHERQQLVCITNDRAELDGGFHSSVSRLLCLELVERLILLRYSDCVLAVVLGHVVQQYAFTRSSRCC